MKRFPYIRGQPTEKTPPLERHQPRLPSQVVSTWLERSPPPHGLILAPLGNAPHLSIEAAQSGYRVLVAANNPISRFILHQSAHPPRQADLKSALAALASTFKGKERLEPHILSLYATDCPRCGKAVSAQALLWKRGAAAPHAKICRCPHCGESSQSPTTPAEIQKATQYQNNRLYHARALTRVAPPGDPIRPHAEKALTAYTSRAVYALFTILNKFSGMPLSLPEEACLSALILSACYRAASLWAHPPGKQPITQLRPPAQYRENNVWFALEDAVEEWARDDAPIPLAQWPELPPPEGGISIYSGPMRDLASQLDEKIGAVIMALPRPNQAYWTLSALWSGWLWGQKAAAPLRNILRLPELDWSWYTRALDNVMGCFRPLLEASTPCLGLVCEAEVDFLIAAILAAHTAGLALQDLALDAEAGYAQILWQPRPKPTPSKSPPDVKSILRSAGYTQLKEMGEPAPSLALYAAGLAALDAENAFPGVGVQAGESTFQELKNALGDTYAYAQGFLRYPKVERWWHQELDLRPLSLSDRVEKTLVNLLAKREQPCSRTALEEELYSAFPGTLTPDAKLIQVCLDSYGEEIPPQSDHWQLRPGDSPSTRRTDLDEMADLIHQLGQQLHYRPKKAPPLGNIRVFTWSTGDEVVYTFFISASAILSKIILKYPRPPTNPWIVLPGGRANLVTHKLRHNPPLKKAIEGQWGFLKYRHLRLLASDGGLTQETLRERLEQDPLIYTVPQLPLF